MTSHFHLRLTYDIANTAYVTYAEQRTKDYILVQENADEDCKQTHLHLHCKTFHKNDQAFRREVKKWFPNLQGNQHYSLKQGNEKGYHYVCKGTGPDWDTGKPHILATSFDENDIKEFHRIYWNHANRTIVNLADAVPDDKPKKRPRTKLFMEKLRDELVTELPDKLWNIDLDTDAEFLGQRLLKRLGETAKNLDTIVFTRLMWGLYNGLPKSYESDRAHTAHFMSAFYRSK